MPHPRPESSHFLFMISAARGGLDRYITAINLIERSVKLDPEESKEEI